ncbi:UNVERIFIED_CONTAM: protein trichome birefringence-like 13 [Sesamum calycinum]|uniref:Protein trichome birefringence-like 13 n=1 Tax=Sesamum calycinum TaxID=2727403 RepID=A0AAW2PL87_9LAMI
MATRDLHYASKKLAASTSSLASRLLLSILCLVSLFLCFSLFRDYTESPSLTYSVVSEKSNSKCNYSDGRWIYDPTVRSPPRYDHTCKEIFKGWNCIASNKSNAIDILKWRWKPYGCDLPPFDPLRFLENFRDTNIGRWSASSNGGKLESLGYKEGYRIDVDLPEGTWAEAPSFHDILIFNTGHWWWAPSKFDPVKSPMLFFEKGLPVTPPIAPDAGLDMVLEHMVSYVEKNARPSTILFFRTQSPRHFENGDWNQGGSCPRLQPLVPQELEQLFSLKNNGTNVETRLVNQHLHKALKGSSFHILDITHMSESRADAHPSTAGGKRHDDCMHWCLPGLTDTWNDLFIAHLNSIKGSAASGHLWRSSVEPVILKSADLKSFSKIFHRCGGVESRDTSDGVEESWLHGDSIPFNTRRNSLLPLLHAASSLSSYSESVVPEKNYLHGRRGSTIRSPRGTTTPPQHSRYSRSGMASPLIFSIGAGNPYGCDRTRRLIPGELSRYKYWFWCLPGSEYLTCLKRNSPAASGHLWHLEALSSVEPVILQK